MKSEQQLIVNVKLSNIFLSRREFIVKFSPARRGVAAIA